MLKDQSPGSLGDVWEKKKNPTTLQPHRSRVQVQKNCLSPPLFLASGFPCVWGVWESWTWDELHSGGCRAGVGGRGGQSRMGDFGRALDLAAGCPQLCRG